MAAREGEQVAGQIMERHRAAAQGRGGIAQRQHLTGPVQQGCLIGLLPVDRARAMRFADRQPGLCSGKAHIGGVGNPGHRRAGAVARQGQRPVGDGFGVFEILKGDVDLRQAQFLAIIEEDIAAQAGEQQHLHPAIGVRIMTLAPARHGAGGIVIFKGPAWPADPLFRRPFLQRVPDERTGQRGRIEEVEAIGGVEAMVALREGLHFPVIVRAADLCNGEAVGIGVEHGADLFQKQGKVRVALAIQFELEIEWPGAQAAIVGGWRIVAQFRIVHRMVDRVDAKAVDAPVQPEADDVEDRGLHVRVMQVQLRLFAQEAVHIILAAPRIPCPGRASEHRLPVIGRRSVRLGIRPDIPVGPGIVAAGPAFDEPAMLVRRMRPYLIDDHAQAKRMGAGDQRVEIRKRAENGIDIAIVGHVIAEIAHRAFEHGRQPDGIDAKRCHIGQARGDAVEIADAIAIGVSKTARIDLIDGGAAPPWL